MISVIILINGEPITGRSAHRVTHDLHTECSYEVDDGRTIKHQPKDGAVKLAIKMLEGIKE